MDQTLKSWRWGKAKSRLGSNCPFWPIANASPNYHIHNRLCGLQRCFLGKQTACSPESLLMVYSNTFFVLGDVLIALFPSISNLVGQVWGNSRLVNQQWMIPGMAVPRFEWLGLCVLMAIRSRKSISLGNGGVRSAPFPFTKKIFP